MGTSAVYTTAVGSVDGSQDSDRLEDKRQLSNAQTSLPLTDRMRAREHAQVVELMGRNDLAEGGGERAATEEDGERRGGGGGSGGGGNGSKVGFDGLWTRYVLAEGLDADATGPFAKYRGLFADEVKA